ncbi:CHAT domain-containing protein [Amycolatopsis sp. QT-25]|uniref:CHAT domain-containing protein n=1 Tax=Amycolatopsis sp. QT-25 TaxID=3034022 RepID=UPI0023ECE868|nr:CHAT domain-containing protein [Amycolatopsis sp. QT-25]WET76200.1 CHAT domain-containing protein [Amycolatopsis sp. QT-25]
MADASTSHQEALRLAARLRTSPDLIDLATAAEAGIDLLYALEADAGTEDLRLVTGLIGFAVRAAPAHPSLPQWWGELGVAHGWIAEQTGSAAEYGTAIACSLTAVSAPQAPPEVAERAAVEAANLTCSLLRSGEVTPGRAQQLIKALDAISLSWTDALNAVHFEFGRAWTLRWSYPLTADVAELSRAADILRQALTAPVLAEATEDHTDGLDLLITVLEHLYFAKHDPTLLEEALVAAVKVRELLPEDHESLPEAHGVVAAIADEIFWSSDGEASAMLETAVTSFAAKRATIGLDDDETVSYALLLQVRGCDEEDVSALSAAVEILETPERAQGAEVVLAGLHELLIRFAGSPHAWQTIDWASRALALDDLGPEVVTPLHGSRIIGLAAALEAFGGDEVAARYDVGAILADAWTEALAGDGADRAELGFQTARLRSQWVADRFPLDTDLTQAATVELADALHRVRPHADEDHEPGLAAAVTVVEDWVPVLMGERDPGPLRAALQDRRRQGSTDADNMLTWLDRCIALKATLDSGQPAGPHLQEALAGLSALMPNSEQETGAGALARLFKAFAETAGGDTATRSAACLKVIRLCDELPPNMISSPLVRQMRGLVAARLAVGGHDGDQAEPAIEDLERVLENRDGHWPEADTHVAESLGQLLRRRGGPGDAERSRRLGLRALAWQTWYVLTRPDRDRGGPTPRFAHVVGDWCREDNANDDLVRVVEAERTVALARGTGAALLHRHLVDAGRADLAEEWVAANEADAPWAARHPDLVSRLSEGDEQALAEPLGPEEIRPLLRGLGLDALVYLVPRKATAGGLMVVVPAEGAATSAQLPLLTEEWFTKNTSAEPAALGGWAWLAGGAAVLAAAKAVAPGRVPRVAVVPGGMLSSVPWAAAWRETGAGRTHLVEDVQITVVPSARLLARSSPAGGEPVILRGDSDLDEVSSLLVKGTRSVVSEIWPVADDSELISLFRHYLGEMTANPAAALREAQLRMLENLGDIARWGGFAHFGG